MNRILVVTVCALAGASLAHGQRSTRAMKLKQIELPAVLRKAIEEGPKLRYVGRRTVTFRRNGEQITYQEIVTRDGPRLRIEFPTGSLYAGQVIVETSRDRRHYFPDKNEIHVLPPRREEAFERLARLATMGDRVRISTADGQAIAGIDSAQVIVADRNGNVMQRLFIDPRSGLLLKRQMFDPVGTEIGAFEFTRVDFRARISHKVFRLERRGASVLRPVDLLKRMADAAGFFHAYLPGTTGYTLQWSRVHKAEGRDVLVSFYTSGDQRRLSLFQVRADLSPEQLARYARGDLQVHAWKRGNVTFVLVGSLDREALRRLAGQVAYGT